jgi:hypothetical protein
MPLRPVELRLAEFAERFERLDALTAKQGRDLEIQFQRIAQIQAELDQMRSAAANVQKLAKLGAKGHKLRPEDH